MKFLLTLFGVLLFIGSFAQDIPKNADIIIVKGTTFDKVVNSLLDSGYTIDKMDKEYGTVKTEYKKLCKDCIPEIFFNVRVKDSIATINGKWRSSRNILNPLTTKKTEDNAFIFEIKNEKSKVPKLAFGAMKTFALSLNGQMTYATSK